MKFQALSRRFQREITASTAQLSLTDDSNSGNAQSSDAGSAASSISAMTDESAANASSDGANTSANSYAEASNLGVDLTALPPNIDALNQLEHMLGGFLEHLQRAVATEEAAAKAAAASK